MSKRKHISLEESYNDVVRQTIEECNLCGACVNDCTIFPFTPLKGKAPDEIMQK